MDEKAALCARIGSAVRERRRALGWSQEHLGERAELSTHFIGLVERGQELPSMTTLVHLAQILGVDVPHLVRGVSKVAPEAAWERDALTLLRDVPAALRPGIFAMLRALAGSAPRQRSGTSRRRR